MYKAWLLGATVAVKQASSRKKTSGEALLREIRYLKLVGPHPNIIQPYGAFSERGRLHLVMEYARHSLRSDRVARSADPLLVLAGVARALVRLHGLGIIHRDLKARASPPGSQTARVLVGIALRAASVHTGAQRARRRAEPRSAHRLRPRVPRAAGVPVSACPHAAQQPPRPHHLSCAFRTRPSGLAALSAPRSTALPRCARAAPRTRRWTSTASAKW